MRGVSNKAGPGTKQNVAHDYFAHCFADLTEAVFFASCAISALRSIAAYISSSEEAITHRRLGSARLPRR